MRDGEGWLVACVAGWLRWLVCAGVPPSWVCAFVSAFVLSWVEIVSAEIWGLFACVLCSCPGLRLCEIWAGGGRLFIAFTGSLYSTCRR